MRRDLYEVYWYWISNDHNTFIYKTWHLLVQVDLTFSLYTGPLFYLLNCVKVVNCLQPICWHMATTVLIVTWLGITGSEKIFRWPITCWPDNAKKLILYQWSNTLPVSLLIDQTKIMHCVSKNRTPATFCNNSNSPGSIAIDFDKNNR